MKVIFVVNRIHPEGNTVPFLIQGTVLSQLCFPVIKRTPGVEFFAYTINVELLLVFCGVTRKEAYQSQKDNGKTDFLPLHTAPHPSTVYFFPPSRFPLLFFWKLYRKYLLQAGFLLPV